MIRYTYTQTYRYIPYPVKSAGGLARAGGDEYNDSMGLALIKQARQAAREDDGALERTVREIISDVRGRGAEALFEYAERFDGARPRTLRVGREAVLAAYDEVPAETLAALRFAHGRIKNFAERQRSTLKELRFTDGAGALEMGHRLLPVDSCGCYVPAGRNPLPSSALMSVTTARAAGVRRVAAASPAFDGRGVHPAVLAAMDIAGADEIYCMGGAGAIAAFAYGLRDCGLAKVDMIAGPGNRFVTEAKRQVAARGAAGIDGAAGPSEVLIIADGTANPHFVAIDLLAQAEHDADAAARLVCTSRAVLEAALAELESLLADLPEDGAAALSWRNNGEAFLADSLDDAITLANRFAPEHVELQIDEAALRGAAGQLTAYGSLFAGHYAPAAFGDFVSGTNHILPTAGSARFSGGLWVGTFLRAAFYQFVPKEACAALAAPCMTLAETEGLSAHRESVRLRIEDGNA
ncbi:MAG: histidinol dehydrogenase [Spirochaetaceae bacterium]|nr:histidinol dehydrogenase [Spirochaetaceae bacterium]